MSMTVLMAQEDTFWDIKTAIARAVVNNGANPTLAELEQEILEEFGQPPDKKLIRYFNGILAEKQRLQQEKKFWDIKTSIARSIVNREAPTLSALREEIFEEFGHQPEPELVEYFNQLLADKRYEVREKEFRSIKRSIARSVAESPSASLAMLQEEIMDEFGHMPDPELVAYFNDLLAAKKKEAEGKTDIYHHFADQVARGYRPTVLGFREAFIRQFGKPPSEELTRYFLSSLKRGSRTTGQETAIDQAKIEFTRTVANGLVKTVLQFHKVFDRAFNEPPEPELIEFFIKNLPRKRSAA